MNLKINKHMSPSGLNRHKCDIVCEPKAKHFLHRKIPQVLHMLILDTIKKVSACLFDFSAHRKLKAAIGSQSEGDSRGKHTDKKKL